MQSLTNHMQPLILAVRTLFGVSNSSFRTDFLFNEPSPYTLLSKEQRQIIAHLKSVDPTLEDVLSPISELYYDGPMGGYGANLKARPVGYHITSSESLERALELRQINVPVISTACAFQQFILSTKDMTRAVAIIEHSPVMCDPSNRDDISHFEEEKLFYAVVYEKRTHSDALYVYTSGALCFDLDYVKAYFRSKFFLFTPDKIRQSLEISGLYAIQDAKYLTSNMKVPIEAPMFLNGMQHRFYLNKVFSYNEKSLMQDHVTSIIDAMSNRVPLIKP